MKYGILGIVIIALTATAYGEFQTRLAQRAFTRYDHQMQQAERDYARATERATREYRDAMARALEVAKRGGSEQEVQEIEEALSDVEGARLERRIRDAITGVWQDQSGRVEFASDGRVLRSYVAGVGQWRVLPDGLVEVVFEAGTTPRWLVAVPGGSDRAVCIRFRTNGDVGAGALHIRE